ncbi:hypothetical protein CDL15_Pgr004343 [Punica granatum]|uniref:Myb/SANT-like domain-containing protein n=1 Tax=Punica granatum TaxID=22663 RepID=A0A218XHU1_PUNGR|nr:hypothetical protein CDL15_Pgr004343 [Punica granatum]
MEGSSASVTSQVSKSGKNKWTLAEDATLISCMVDLRNMGTHNADTGFKPGYLLELEKMLLEKLPNCSIKARPHIESRLKTLKKEWAITHKEAAPFRLKSFLHFEELSMIHSKDRATGKDAQAVEDILQELEVEDLIGAAEQADVNPSNQNEFANANTPTSRDASRAHLPPIEDPRSASSGKKRKKNEADFSMISQAVNTMAADMKEVCMMLPKSVHSDIIQEKFLELPGALCSVDGLTSAQNNKVNFFLEFFGIFLLGYVFEWCHASQLEI